MSLAVAATIRRIEPTFVHRPWGREDLSPLFGAFKQKIGEVWFPVGAEFPLLVKFLFTSDRLSVQVHPDDKFAALAGQSRGKTEMWHVLSAEPGATVAVGMKTSATLAELRNGIANGAVVGMLNWIPVTAGDTIYVPAGTVHALGRGLIVCEVQQNSDITYRLYDYGSDRPLHLDQALAVSRTEVYDGRRELPVHCEHFTTDLLEFSSQETSRLECGHLLVALSGFGTIAGEPFTVGECWFVPAGAGTVELRSETTCKVLRTRCDCPK
jgi:mannose-6-phosphate isomerase